MVRIKSKNRVMANIVHSKEILPILGKKKKWAISKTIYSLHGLSLEMEHLTNIYITF